MLARMRDCLTGPALEACVMFWRDQPQARVYRKQDNLRRFETAEGFALALDFPVTCARLAMAVVYEGAGFAGERKGQKTP